MLRLMLRGAFAGVFATASMDLSLLVGKRTGFVGGSFPMPVGRWIYHALHGTFGHGNILETPPVPAEGSFTVAAHYVIGTTLGVVFMLVTAAGVSGSPLVEGLVFGTLTGLLPWLVMFPGMGFGAFGLRGPPEARLFWNSLYTHLGYGLGLAVWATWVYPRL